MNLPTSETRSRRAANNPTAPEMAPDRSKSAALGPMGRKAALTVHLLFVALWFGAAIAMVLLIALRPAKLQSDSELVAYCVCVTWIDDWIIIGAAGGSLLSGLFLSWKTPWGFFKWYWVSIKLVATVAMVAFGATCLGPWINQAHQLAAAKGLSALQDVNFQVANRRVLIWGVLQILLLALLIGISIFKPWGRIAARRSEL